MLYLTGPSLALDWLWPAKGNPFVVKPRYVHEDEVEGKLERRTWQPRVMHQALADYLHRRFALDRSPMSPVLTIDYVAGDQILLAEYSGPWLHPEALFLPPQAHVSYWLIETIVEHPAAPFSPTSPVPVEEVCSIR